MVRISPFDTSLWVVSAGNLDGDGRVAISHHSGQSRGLYYAGGARGRLIWSLFTAGVFYFSEDPIVRRSDTDDSTFTEVLCFPGTAVVGLDHHQRHRMLSPILDPCRYPRESRFSHGAVEMEVFNVLGQGVWEEKVVSDGTLPCACTDDVSGTFSV